MRFDAANRLFTAEGIPITPLDDQGRTNFLPLMRLVARNSAGAELAHTDIALPVGDQMDCRTCHASNALPGSGASAAIAGVANTNPPGPVTTNATGQVDQPFSYRIIVTNPGKDHAQDFWNAAPLPPGLTINTNVGGDGKITGTPTVAGAYPVKLTAGNVNSDQIVYKDITITIAGGAAPPGITVQPASQIVTAGANVTLTVTATGDSLACQWRLNGNDLPNETASTLTLTGATPAQSGLYSVVVSNNAGSVTSDAAQLLVVNPPDATTAPALGPLTVLAGQITLTFNAAAGYRYLVETSDTLDASSWTTLTNLPPAFTAATVNLPQNVADGPRRFYRVKVSAD